MAASLDAVVARLEGVAARLEASEVLPIIVPMAAIHPRRFDTKFGFILLPSCNVQAKLTSTGSAQLPSARSDAYADAPSKSSSTVSGSLQAWDSSISPLVSSFKAASDQLGSEVRRGQPAQIQNSCVVEESHRSFAFFDARWCDLQIAKAGQVMEHAFKVCVRILMQCMTSRGLKF